MGNLSRWLLVLLASAASLAAPDAAAAPPGEWSIAVERLFGFSRTTADYGDATFTDTSFSVSAKVAGRYAYSVPRLAIDYLASSGVTFGGAVGVQFVEGDGDGWLLAPRIGYFARPGRSFGLWPRAGLTLLYIEDGSSDGDNATALTLEMPLEFLVSHGAAITLTPFAEIGLGGSENDQDRTITEIGLQFGLGLFF
jgi:hypothetical protein